MKFKKLVFTFLLGMGLTFTTVLGYATISYVMNKVIDQSVTVGNTVQYTDGLFVELSAYDNYTLTYLELEETSTSRHYVTYTYDYIIYLEGYGIEVSSLTDDIVVSGLTSTETTISITFSLNQEKEYNEGDILNIQFYFEAVDYSIINMNDTTINALISIGFTEREATDIIAYEGTFTQLSDVYINVDISDAITRFQPLVTNGTIVFE